MDTTRKAAARVAALCASAAATAVIVGSQLGLAHHYVKEADVLMAAKRAVLAQSASAPAKGKPAT